MAADADLPLIPLDDEGTTPEEDLAAAEASALDAPTVAPIDPEVPEPFGRTPLFDFKVGRYVRAGGSPLWVSGREAAKQWVLMAIHSARYAHGVFSDSFGMEEPDSILGEAADVVEAASDWGERLREAILVHDRFSAVEDFIARYEPTEGILYIDNFTIVTDEQDRLEFGPLDVPVGRGEES